MVKQDDCFAVSAKDGSMRPEEFAGDGLWLGDTRILSRFRLRVDGKEPELVHHQVVGGCATFELRAGALQAKRERFVDGGLRERITISNPGGGTVSAVAEVDVAADFAAMLVVRGIVRELPMPQAAAPIETGDGVRFASDRGDAYTSHRRRRAAGFAPRDRPRAWRGLRLGDRGRARLLAGVDSSSTPA